MGYSAPAAAAILAALAVVVPLSSPSNAFSVIAPTSYVGRHPPAGAAFSISPLGQRRIVLGMSSLSSSDEAPPSAAAAAEAVATTNRKPRSGDVVTVDLTLTPRDGFVPEPLFDSSGRVTFVLDGGNYLPGLHDLLRTMIPGETVKGATLDAGWGERREDLIAKVPKEGGDGLDYDKIKVGTELYLANGVKCTVIEVTEEDFTIDANAPLAGATYLADATLVAVEEGPTIAEWGEETTGESSSRYDIATIALGCFWGGELAYMRAPGVVGTRVGYTQGDVPNPTYKDVCSGTTGHTEAIHVIYDPSVVTYEELVKLGMDRLGESRFLLNQVGNDKGTQYRHGVYYHNDEQEEVARRVVSSYGPECKTEVLPATTFYDAEEYHQQYLLKGGQSARKGEAEAIRCYG